MKRQRLTTIYRLPQRGYPHMTQRLFAAVLAMGVLLILSIIDLASTYLTGTVADMVMHISLTNHLESFARGVIDTHDIVYYCVFTSFMLFLTVRSLESRRWR